jgi:hypothetical protein
MSDISGFAKSVGSRLLNKHVIIYQGTEHHTVLRAEIESATKTVVCGKLVEVLEDCLVIEVEVGGTFANAYINTYSVYSMLEVKNLDIKHNISIFDIYVADENRAK